MTPVEQDPARELVARAIREATDTELDDCLDDEEACFAQKIHLGAETDGVVRMVYASPDMIAEVAVAALAGRLLPAGGEERTEWGEACDVDMCKLPHGMCCYADDASDHKHTHHRTVTEWPDGSTYTTGWVEVGTDG